MDNWVFPTSLFFLGFVIWVFSLLFAQKQTHGVVSIISGVIGGVSLLLLFQRDYHAFASVLLCLVLSILIIGLGFDISFQKTKYKGPLADFVGKEGITLTDLEPKGKVQLDGQEILASSEGLFVAAGTKVKVLRCGEKILVIEKVVDGKE